MATDSDVAGAGRPPSAAPVDGGAVAVRERAAPPAPVPDGGASAPSAPARSSRRSPPSWQTRPLGYLPALDGIRALAVALVIAYHLGYGGVAGGYIGVEVFFVLSGWLVCALLVNERQRTGSIALGGFWLRRARRLLPAVVAVIVVTLAVASAVRPETLAELRGQSFAALTYHLNWRAIFDQQSYFAAAGGPTGLEHLWSLSIEEQFYLVFPLLCWLVLTRVSRKAAVGVALAGAVLATVWRFALVDPGADPSRLYFGTDTRAAGLLLGVALGLFWTPNRLRPHTNRVFAGILDSVALLGAAAVAWYAFGLDEHAPAAFRGGFTAAELGTLLVVAVAVYPAPTFTAAALSLRPLRWVGRRSYGIYLIHWPVIVFLSAAPGEQPESPRMVAVQIALVLLLAELSYRLVERPVRARGLVEASRHGARHLVTVTAGRPAATLAALVGCVVLVGTAVDVTRDVMAAAAPTASQPASVVIGAGDPPPTTVAPPAPDEAAPAGDEAAPAGEVAPTPPPAPTTTTPAPGSPVPTTAIGDSVLVGAAPVIAGRLGDSFTADAAIGRQMNEAADLVAQLDSRGELGDVVLLHLGNNGPFSAEEIDRVMAAIGPDRTVLLVNVMVPRQWEGEVNEQLAAAAARHPNATLVDWYSLVTSEGGLTREDGYHLTAAGAERYADLVVGQVPRR